MNGPARLSTPELMDDPAGSDRDLRASLRDLAQINRYFGARAFVLAYLDRILPLWRTRRRSPSDPLILLDVATGAADIPIAVAEWAAARAVPVRVVAIDRHPMTAVVARQNTAAHPSISVVRADARLLPFADGMFDVCLCSLALHHLNPEDGLALLRQFYRLGRLGFLVVDLLRCWSGYVGVWLLTRLSRSALIRHDGPLSVRRAFSWQEYLWLAAASEIPGVRVRRLPLFRVAVARIA
jgi:SAM-dependent methyltransferase